MSLAYHPPVSSKAALGGDWWMNSKVMLAVDLQVDLQSRVGGRCGFGQISTSGFLAAVKLKWSLALFTFSATSCAQHCLSPGFSLSLSLSLPDCVSSAKILTGLLQTDRLRLPVRVPVPISGCYQLVLRCCQHIIGLSIAPWLRVDVFSVDVTYPTVMRLLMKVSCVSQIAAK